MVAFGLYQLELAEYYGRISMKASPLKKVQTWLDTVHAGEPLAHMLDDDAVGERPSSAPCEAC